MPHRLLAIAHAIQENIVPTGFVGGGITIGYTRLLDNPLLNVLPDPSLLSEVKDLLTICSLTIGMLIMIINFIRSLRKKDVDKNKDT